MKVVLFLDTSVFGFSFALKELKKDGALLYEYYGKSGKGTSFQLSSLLNEALKLKGLTVDSVSVVVVSRGPGSFTGIRLGLSWAEGFCFPSSGKNLVGYSSLEALVTYFAKEKNLDFCSFLLANTKTTGFLASFKKGKCFLSFVDEEATYDEASCGPLFIDSFYEGALQNQGKQSFSKEDIAQKTLQAFVSEVDVTQEKFSNKDVYPATPLYLRKSSVEERLEKKG